jgi:hypothetical protein
MKIKKIKKKLKELKINKKYIILIIIAILLIAIVLSIFSIVMLKDDVKNAIWVKGYHMNDVDLDTLSDNGIENIFLHSSAVSLYGEDNVSAWIKKANDKNIKVHLWVQCFYNETWVNPIDTEKKDFNYPYFDQKIEEIDRLSNIPGVSGIHLDYIRYPGNAYEYDYPNGVNSANAITKFVSMASDKVKGKGLTLSATVMPEREGKKYYGQDVWKMSWYVDAIVPMAYVGNYNEDAAWIKDISSYFKTAAMWSKVCIGIQTYSGDNNETPLPAQDIKENCQAAMDGGADGVGLFTWELMKNWFDLRELK